MVERGFRAGMARRGGVVSEMLAAAAFGLAAPALGGGTAENALVIVDPSNPASMYLANYYKAARDIPESHFLYMEPGAASWATFRTDNLDGLNGHFANSGARDLIDYIVIAPTDVFFMPAAGLVNDTCSPVTRFSLTAGYTMAQIASKINGGVNVAKVNHYFRNSNETRGFSSLTSWLSGLPNTGTGSERYFIGAQLGYLGANGNTVSELIQMIDRSAAVDGTRPAGTVYYMKTTDALRSGPRDGSYDARVTDLTAGGQPAQRIDDVLPLGRNDCLGIMTGWAAPDITNANLAILPGAFCDHLTSFAATFDNGSQTKLSRWIARGASGSWGAVEEPCNYAGKFPIPRIHVTYTRGLTLGEAALRAANYAPFQSMLYGDPLTRPFAYVPSISVPDAPSGPVSGSIILTPQGSTPSPTAALLQSTLVVDGRPLQTVPWGQSFTLDTTALSDGWHDLRVVTIDNTLAATAGRWTGSLLVDNRGGAVTLNAGATTGNLTTDFGFAYSATGPNVQEVRLVHNGRVIAASSELTGVLTVKGLTIGAGPSRLFAEAAVGGGRFVRSAPLDLDIAFSSGTPSGAAPLAFSYRKYVRGDAPAVIELPTVFDDQAVTPTWQVLTNPAQGTFATGSGPYRIFRPGAGASGSDSFTFRVQAGPLISNVATVTLIYLPCISDADEDGVTDLDDLLVVLANFGSTVATRAQGDLDESGLVDLDDLLLVLAGFGGCP
jgi:hypothetical protein